MSRRDRRARALVVGGLVVGFVPFFAGVLETSTFSGSVNRRLFMAYEFADFTYKSDAKKAVDQIEEFLWRNKEESRRTTPRPRSCCRRRTSPTTS